MNSTSAPPRPIVDGLTQMQQAYFLAWNAWAATFWTLQQNQWERWATWMGGGAPLDI
jgi:hypothetical protein